MERKIIMNLAISIDGFIADEKGGFDWIVGDKSTRLDTDKKWDYKLFLKGIDTVVMGKACYDQNMQSDFTDKKVFVATRSSITDYDNMHFISGDICKIIDQERKKEGKDIFLFGGGVLVDNFLKADIIDEFIVGIIPVILGKGRPLFLGNNPMVKLELEEYIVDGGIVIVRYKRRADI